MKQRVSAPQKHTELAQENSYHGCNSTFRVKVPYQRKTIGVIYIDFQKAFDCVNHEILSYKLRAAGLSSTLYDWIIDYLSNRKQFVKVNGVSSNLMDIDTGVPQGSLLGPRLYSIYSNNLSSYSTN